MLSKQKDVPYCGVRKIIIENSVPKLNEGKLKLLSKWITERYNIHLKKDVHGQPKPWTECPILQNIKFTNVRREDDRATIWAIEYICKSPNLSMKDKILNLILFRLYNKWQTCDLLGMPFKFAMLETTEPQFRGILERKEQLDPDYVFFTSAFNTGGMKAAVGRTTGEEYIPMRPIAFMKLLKKENIATKILDCHTPQCVVKELMKHKGIGEFLAYQMFVDFTYCEEYPFSENHYTVAGPGCKMGIDFLFEDTDGMTHNECIFWLRDNQDVLGINFKELFSNLEEHDQVINVMSLENCFCEFSKYVRATEQLAEGKTPRARVSYDGGNKMTDKTPKKESKPEDPNRNIPYMGKYITPEEQAELASIEVDNTIRSSACYQGSLFEPAPTYIGLVYPIPSKRRLFQFLGTNGSGKSTIPKGLVELDKDAYILSTEMAWISTSSKKETEFHKKKVNFCTVLPNLKFILMGDYSPERNIAGADLMVRATMEIALDLIQQDPLLVGYNILMEGVVLSSSAWFIHKSRNELDITPHLMFMDTPLEVCLERLRLRNLKQHKEDGKTKNVEYKMKNIKAKRKKCERGDEGYHDVVAIDVDHTMTIPQSIDWFIDEYVRE